MFKKALSVCLLMSLEKHENFIEALIFASEKSISTEEIIIIMQEILGEELIPEEIQAVIDRIRKKYNSMEIAIELVNINGGYQFLTRKEYYSVVNQLQIHRSKKKLSQAALETLAIIAYKQPITKLEMEQIRGVNCDYTVNKLLDKELISISGKASTVGKPLLYTTSSIFMDYFGINSTEDFPQLKDLKNDNNTIGDHLE